MLVQLIVRDPIVNHEFSASGLKTKGEVLNYLDPVTCKMQGIAKRPECLFDASWVVHQGKCQSGLASADEGLHEWMKIEAFRESAGVLSIVGMMQATYDPEHF